MYSDLPIIPLVRGGERRLVIPVSPLVTFDETNLPEFGDILAVRPLSTFDVTILPELGDSLAVVICFLGDFPKLFSI